MNLDFSAEDQNFREEVRAWLKANVPREQQPKHGPERKAFDLAWQRRQFEGGWAGINWPAEYGGRGLPTLQQLIWHEEYAKADAPDIGVCFVGINHGGPTLIARGSQAQKAFHLPKILKGEKVWCQGFSEPGAGSDLASLSTRAEIDGNHLVVTGQKIWTSYAQYAEYQELLVRTDPSAPKHKGITWVICDMNLPGITIQPLRLISGGYDFCQVFYDEVRIPIENVVGEINDGWSVAMSTLAFERGTAFMSEQVRLSVVVEKLIALAQERPGPDGNKPAIKDDEIARRLAQARAEVAALRAMTYANVSRSERSGVPGLEGSIVKLFTGNASQTVQRLAVDILGHTALSVEYESSDASWMKSYLRGFASTIAAGTAQVQRNIIGERILGLPRER